MNRFRHLGLLIASCLYLTGVSYAQIDAVTKARDDVSLAFLQGGKVVEIPIKPGTLVKANEVLMVLEDKAGAWEIKRLKMRIEKDLSIAISKAQRDLAKVNLDQTKEMYDANAATELELRTRKVEFEIAGLDLDQKKLDLEEAKLQLDKVKDDHRRYTLRAPFDGIVQRVKDGEEVAVGEVVQPGVPVLRLVAVETLTVDAHVPVADTLELNVGHKAFVQAKVSARNRLVNGSVQHIAKVVDPASGTKLVRINVPNQNDYLGAGWQVSVFLSNPQAADQPKTKPGQSDDLMAAAGKDR